MGDAVSEEDCSDQSLMTVVGHSQFAVHPGGQFAHGADARVEIVLIVFETGQQEVGERVQREVDLFEDGLHAPESTNHPRGENGRFGETLPLHLHALFGLLQQFQFLFEHLGLRQRRQQRRYNLFNQST